MMCIKGRECLVIAYDYQNQQWLDGDEGAAVYLRNSLGDLEALIEPSYQRQMGISSDQARDSARALLKQMRQAVEELTPSMNQSEIVCETS